MDASPSKSLSDELTDALPKGSDFTFYHVSTTPFQTDPIYSAPPNEKPAKTYCESHFLNVSISASGQELFVLAIECLIFTTRHLTTVFVSKADSTGYLSLLALDRGHASPLRTVASTFISFLVRHRIRKNVKLVIDLFARASDQYLFPGSVDNPDKHVSDDRQLVKWWCRVLDPVFQSYGAPKRGLFEHGNANGNANGIVVARGKAPDQTTAQGYLIVPGEESILSFLPEAVRYNPEARQRWKHDHPLRDLAHNPVVPPRCLIPNFPDDPKARFLVDLDEEIPDAGVQLTDSPTKRGNGEWKSVRSLEQFWELMAYRSECSSGRLVGFIWILFVPPKSDECLPPSPTIALDSSFESIDGLIANSGQPLKARNPRQTSPTKQTKPRRKLTGPIVARLPRIKSFRSDLSSMIPENSSHYFWPSDSRGELVLDEKKYQKATEMLLKLDFSNQELAAQSTKTWIEQVGLLGGKDNGWGQKVTGTLEASQIKADSNDANSLVAKRKTGDRDGATILSGSLVRKKPKLDGSSGELAAVPQADVNVLGAGLVRKKPKKVQSTLIT
jgi:regulator of Ty1 transposition protein 109